MKCMSLYIYMPYDIDLMAEPAITRTRMTLAAARPHTEGSPRPRKDFSDEYLTPHHHALCS